MLKMKLFYGIVLVMMVFVSACAQQPAAEPEAQSTVQPTEPEPAVEPETEVEDTGAAVAPPEEEESASYDIRYGTDGFDPSELTISAGSSVTWFNDDSKSMVVIVFKDGKNFATPRLNSGQQAETVFTEPGEYEYWWNIAYAPYGGTITVE